MSSPAEPEPAAPAPAPRPIEPAPVRELDRDSRQDFVPGDALGVRLGGGASAFADGDFTGTEGFSGIKVDGLEDGPMRVRGSFAESSAIYLLMFVGAALLYLLWRFVWSSGRSNFAGQDGNR